MKSRDLKKSKKSVESMPNDKQKAVKVRKLSIEDLKQAKGGAIPAGGENEATND